MNKTKWYEKFVSGSEMFFLFQDFWQLVQNFWMMEDVDEYWDAMQRACEEFQKKYHSYFAAKLARAFVDEQERKMRGLSMEECFQKEQEDRIDAKRKSV